MSLYAGDNSDGVSTSSKKKSSKWKSRRKNGNANKKKETRECYGCGKKGHIKRDYRSICYKTAGGSISNKITKNSNTRN